MKGAEHGVLSLYPGAAVGRRPRAEIGGVDLGRVGEEAFAEIRAAWQHLVVFFRDQNITPEQQIAFAKRFGAIHYHPFMKGIDAHPEILKIVKEEGDTRAGEVWHTDQMFSPRPAKATLHYARETRRRRRHHVRQHVSRLRDAVGADAGPARQCQDLERRRSPATRPGREGGGADGCKGGAARGTLHRQCGDGRQGSRPRGGSDGGGASADFRTHPETGRKPLYIGSHTQTLLGFPPAEARPILDFLMAHAVQPELTCRWRWQVGSLAIWDNRCTQHRALNDHHGKRRRMYRITIAGDAPF